MALFDGKGNSIEVGSKYPSRLNGADVIFFGDSNVRYSAGKTMADVGSFYYRFAKEFDINSWVNCGTPGKNSYQSISEFTAWAQTGDNIAKYNKESTILLFWYGTNDELAWWENENQCPSSVARISEFISANFPKAFYAWIIPPATDWSKWTGSTEPDNRNMAEKMPLIITNLEKWGIPYLDLYHQSGIAPSMLPDGVHLGGGGENYTTDAVYRAYRVLREYLINK